MAYNQLTDGEAERLALLAEECGEVVQIIGKILRHGYESYHPDDETRNNRYLLALEIGDVQAATMMLIKAGDVDQEIVDAKFLSKFKKVKNYLHHN